MRRAGAAKKISLSRVGSLPKAGTLLLVFAPSVFSCKPCLD
jgi:hypothetical protein